MASTFSNGEIGSSVRAKLNATANELNALKNTVTLLDGRVTVVTDATNETTQLVNDLAAVVSSVSNTVSDLETTVATLTNTVDNLLPQQFVDYLNDVTDGVEFDAVQSALARFAPLGPSVSTPIVIAGRSFAVLPDDGRRPDNVTRTSPPGVSTIGWFRLAGRDNDNNTGEVGNIRVGFDGFPQKFVEQQTEELFHIVPTATTLVEGVGGSASYLNLRENHVGKHPAYPGEHENKGCFLIILEKSVSLNRMVLRIRNRYFNKLGPITGPSDIIDTMLWQDSAGEFQADNLYTFRVETRRNTPGIADGYIRVWWSINGGPEVQIVNAPDIYHGYGAGRQVWPQFRNYGDNKGVTVVTYLKIDSIVETSGAFTPYSLGSDLLAIWDADAAPHMTLAGSDVASWGDGKSGIVLSELVNRPTLVATGWTDSSAYVAFDGTTDILTAAPSSLPSGAMPCMIWVIAEDEELGSVSTIRYLFAYGSNLNGARSIFRQPSGANDRLRVATGSGAANTVVHNATNLVGKFAAMANIGPTETRLHLNDDAGFVGAVVPNTATDRIRIGDAAYSPPAGGWKGKIKTIAVTTVLTGQDLTDMWSYVMANR